MKIAIIGSGNVATHLAPALRAAGHEICQVYSPTPEHARALADACACEAVSTRVQVTTHAGCYIFALRDDVLQDMAAYLSSRCGEALFVHTAGSMPLDALPTRRRGVLYPMQTFSKDRPVDFAQVPLFVEASTQEDLQILRELATSLSNSVIELDSERRRHLHLAAVYACNFVNHCYALSAHVLEAEGMDFSLMHSLIAETCAKAQLMHPHDAQTGPAVRYDQRVMQRQLQLLDGHPRLQDIYRIMSKSIHEEQTSVK